LFIYFSTMQRGPQEYSLRAACSLRRGLDTSDL